MSAIKLCGFTELFGVIMETNLERVPCKDEMLIIFQNQARVAVLGASGGIGQPLALLLKNNRNVSELALYDILNTPGVAADLSHCSTRARVTAYNGPDQLADCLKGCEVVVIPAGVPRKPGERYNQK